MTSKIIFTKSSPNYMQDSSLKSATVRLLSVDMIKVIPSKFCIQFLKPCFVRNRCTTLKENSCFKPVSLKLPKALFIHMSVNRGEFLMCFFLASFLSKAKCVINTLTGPIYSELWHSKNDINKHRLRSIVLLLTLPAKRREAFLFISSRNLA